MYHSVAPSGDGETLRLRLAGMTVSVDRKSLNPASTNIPTALAAREIQLDYCDGDIAFT